MSRLRVLRQIVRPAGRHRRPAPIDLPADAEPGEFRYCPEELRTTYHAIHADDTRTCWTCNTTTETT